MDEQLHNAPLSFNCNQDWESMQPVTGGRFCNSCQKKVHDFTDKNTAYFMEILAENNYSICGRFRQEQLPTVPVQYPLWKKWAVAAMVFIGMSTFMERAKAQLTGKIAAMPPRPALLDTGRTRLGEIVVLKQPEFPGGNIALSKFLRSNFRIPAHVPDGRLLIQFSIQKDGTLKNIQVVKGLAAELDKEAVRVMRLSPKWNPPYTGSLATETVHTLPITFRSGKVVMP